MSWIEAVLRAIAAQKHLPYGRSKEGSDVVEGATKSCEWLTDEILRRGDHVSCVYSVMETLMDAMASLDFEDYRNEHFICAEDMQELKEWCFVYDDDKRQGIAGGLEELGMGRIIDVSEARAGDVAQIWDTTDGKVVFGHCVIILGEEPGTKYPALTTWSAEPNEGNVRSWRYIEQPNASKLREWIIGRPGF